MTRVTIIGAGFSGIGMAARLVQSGHTDLVVLERGQDVGGVWRDNTYPGAACDVASHLYSFSFAPEGRWTRRFAPQREIHAYLRRVAEEQGVLPLVRFGIEVSKAVYDETRRGWDLHLSDGTTHATDVLVTACGQLSRPSYPQVEGLEQFAGASFHSAEWDADVDVTGKRVLVLGTGASAIQFVPEIAKTAAHVTVLQRSAPYVIPKPDRPYSPRAQRMLARHPLLLKADRAKTFVTNEARSLGFNTAPKLLAGHQRLFSRQLHRQVPDPVLREKLTPDYLIGCKRILISNDWYPALMRANVDLVTEPVTRVTAAGVETSDGASHAGDVLVMGTGFAATELLLPMEVVGRDGLTMRDAWKDGAEAYLGTAVGGFPNLFLLYGPNTNLGHNSIILMLESQFSWVQQAVQRIRPGGSLEVRPEVQRSYNAWLQKRLKRTVFAAGCTSWYLTKDGRNTQNWPGTTVAFRLRTRRLRDADVLVELPRPVLVRG